MQEPNCGSNKVVTTIVGKRMFRKRAIPDLSVVRGSLNALGVQARLPCVPTDSAPLSAVVQSYAGGRGRELVYTWESGDTIFGQNMALSLSIFFVGDFYVF